MTLGRIFNLLGEVIDEGDEVEAEERWPIHRPAPSVEDLVPTREILETGIKVIDLLAPYPEGRQGRPVRRRRGGQDRAHPGADPQHRRGACGAVGVLRRGRALPRGQRPLARDDRVGRDRQDHARVRPDERAAGRAHARGPVRPDHGGVLPRAGRPGRAALHRQHLPLRAGRLGGLGPAGPDALAGGLPAHPGDRDGPAAGAHHLDPAGLGDLGAGHLRARRRPHRPGAGLGVRAPERHDHAVAGDLREGHLPGRRPARLDLHDPQGGHRGRGALRGGQPGQGDPAALQGAAGHHRHPRHRRALRRGQAHRAARPQGGALPLAAVLRGRGVHRHPRAVRADRGDRAVLQGDHRGQARRHPRASVPAQGDDRRRGGGCEGRPRRGREARRAEEADTEREGEAEAEAEAGEDAGTRAEEDEEREEA